MDAIRSDHLPSTLIGGPKDIQRFTRKPCTLFQWFERRKHLHGALFGGVPYGAAAMKIVGERIEGADFPLYAAIT